MSESGIGREPAERAPLQCLQLQLILTHFSIASITAQGFYALVLIDKSTQFYTGDIGCSQDEDGECGPWSLWGEMK